MGSENAKQPLWHGLVAGGCAAMVSRVFTYPPDTVKARLQVQESSGRLKSSSYNGTVDAFFKIAEREGIRGFYRGFGALLVTVVPANMCYFSGYEIGKRISPKSWKVGSDVVTAVFAQALAGIVYCPIDIVKQAVQTSSIMHGDQVLSPTQAAQSIWRSQGIRGFYRGFLAMNTLWMPWNLIYLTMYEASKRRAYEWKLGNSKYPGTSKRGEPDGLPPWVYPVCSSSCAAVAAIVTHPIDVVKTRLQVISARSGKAPSSMEVARELWGSQGLAGFQRGMSARVMTMCVAPHSAGLCMKR
eukprot:jgi/Picre1/30887/NNA_006246.t1